MWLWSSGQQQQNDEAIEMRHVHKEISPENDAFTIDMEQFNTDIGPDNANYEATYYYECYKA